jgi:AhpD family alkylhydroperoxidase
MNEKVFIKKVYTHTEGYKALYKGMRTLKYLIHNKKEKLISNTFLERIMLAVTEVNGCEVCAYGHTKMALEAGMDKEEIMKLLDGNKESIPADEVEAILFAQHYADSRGNPSVETWNRIKEIYDDDKSYIILAAIRMIMIGNVFGIPLSAIIRRFKRKVVHKTNLFYEITMLLGFVIFLPFALFHALILNISHAALIR